MNVPTQKHKRVRARSKTPRSDKSQAHISNVKGTKSNRQSGVEGSVRGGRKGMAKKPEGTRVVAPGGRVQKSKGYAL